ncbi:hypothetical protein SLE2022_064220 [Rubroshorea leprosula]
MQKEEDGDGDEGGEEEYLSESEEGGSDRGEVRDPSLLCFRKSEDGILSTSKTETRESDPNSLALFCDAKGKQRRVARTGPTRRSDGSTVTF